MQESRLSPSTSSAATTAPTAAPGPPALSDAFQRRRALAPEGSFHLEAPAGSGKTFLLTARLLILLGIVDHPRQILALTFTNKAAGEMRERVCTYLNRAKACESPSNSLDAELLDAARKALERHPPHRDLLLGGEILQIQTFHSFCYSLVAQAPLEAGIVPGSILLVEPEQTFFLRETIDRTLREIMSRKPDDPWRRALENRLLYLNNSWPALAGELEALMQRRDVLKDLIRVLDRQRTEDYIAQGIRNLVETELLALAGAFGRSALGLAWPSFHEDLGAHQAGAAGQLPPALPAPVWEDLEGWLALAKSLLTRDGKPRRRFGPATGYYSGFNKTEWFQLIQALETTCAEKLQSVREMPLKGSAVTDFETLWDLILLLNAIMQAYDTRCRKQRLLDFSALEIAALRLLETTQPSDLQLLLDHQVRHLLIDEFQDTNYQQWDLLRHLCSGWLPDEGRSLFVVGDPKQSIYGFRRAEVRLFSEARKGVPQDEFRRWPLEPLVLDTNFRSRPHLIDWCNAIFERTVMTEPREEVDEVCFTRSTSPSASSPEAPGAPPELALFAAWPDAISARRREADWMACRIGAELAAEGPEYKIGVLLFTRTHLPIYLEALQRWSIAAQVSEGLKLLERPEVLYLWQLCRALVFPQDHLAWASQLHSPWLLLSYEDILSLALEPPESWVEKIRSHAAKDGRVASFWENLQTARQRLGHEPLADVLEEAWLDIGGTRITAERWGSRGLASCRRLLELIREAEVFEPVQTLLRVEQLLENAFEPVNPDTALSRVSLMTVHRAKGLEFDSVYIPFLDWKPLARERHEQPPYLLERVTGASEHYLLAARPDRRRGEPDPMYKWLHRIHLDRRWGEAKRLFYVAATRARSKLFLSGILPWQAKDSGPVIASQTPLAWLDQHYQLAEGFDLKTYPQPQEAPAEGAWALKTLETRPGNGGPSSDAFRAILEPPIPAPTGPAFEESASATGIEPAAFERERPLFKIRTPSSLARSADPDLPCEPDEVSPSPHARLWGDLIHRLFESYATGRRLPDIPSICSFLKQQTIEERLAESLAQAAWAEVASCLEDPWLQHLYALPHDRLWVERAVEGLVSPQTLASGRVDLAAFDGETWWLIDFKTAKPAEGEPLEIFCQKELDRYRPQLTAYRDLWANSRNLDTASIRTILYWTGLRHKEAC